MGEIDGFLLFGATIFTAREPFKKGSISIRLTLLRVVFVGELTMWIVNKKEYMFVPLGSHQGDGGLSEKRALSFCYRYTIEMRLTLPNL